MKKYPILLVLFVAIFAIISCKQTDPVDYNNSIIELQRKCIISIDVLKKSIDNFSMANQENSFKDINTAYDSAFFTINIALELTQKMKPYKNDDSLRLAAIALFTAYSDIVQSNYKKMIELYKLPADQYTDVEIATFQQLDVDANRKLDFAFKKFLEYQQSFAKKYNLSIE